MVKIYQVTDHYMCSIRRYCYGLLYYPLLMSCPQCRHYCLAVDPNAKQRSHDLYYPWSSRMAFHRAALTHESFHTRFAGSPKLLQFFLILIKFCTNSKYIDILCVVDDHAFAKLFIQIEIIPALITSTPVGYHRSPCLRSNSTVLFANVRKYSPSSICVPSHSNTTRTGSEAGTPSLSLPKINQSRNSLFMFSQLVVDFRIGAFGVLQIF